MAMGFYSFVVIAPEEVVLPPHYFVNVGRGRNVFNATMNDVEEFKRILTAAGAQVLQVNRLDEYQLPDAVELDPFADEPTASVPR
jgi:hypothetical protein